jgi:gluconolactonase
MDDSDRDVESQPLELRLLAEGLDFPEGPVALPDGSVLVVEMFGERLTRVDPAGTTATVAELRGGPNGAARAPDGQIFVCNNGGTHTKVDLDGVAFPGPCDPAHYIGGRIQTIDLDTGQVTDLYDSCDGNALASPNDLVFDDRGGFYFTDLGFQDGRIHRSGGIYYARTDGSAIREVVFPVQAPNGIGLSPDGTVLYWAESFTGRVMRRRVQAPGVVEAPHPLDTSGCLYGFGGLRYLDSLAVEANGNICVATCIRGGLAVVSPDGTLLELYDTDDYATTNLCFGGPSLTTAFITMSGSGRLMVCEWPRPGLPVP